MANRYDDDGNAVPPNDSVFDAWYEPEDAAGNDTPAPGPFPGEWSMGGNVEPEFSRGPAVPSRGPAVPSRGPAVPSRGPAESGDELDDILTGYLDLRSDDVLPARREGVRRTPRPVPKDSWAPEPEGAPRRGSDRQDVRDVRAFDDDRDRTPGGSDGPRRPRPTRTPSGVGRILVPLALALVAVVALYAGWTKLRESSSPDPFATVTVSSSPFAENTNSPGPSASDTQEPTPSTSEAVTPTPTPEVSTSPSVGPTTPAVEPNRSTPVEVYNATTRAGLAAKVADTLRAAGWDVVKVGNWTGEGVTATTVFATGNEASVTTMKSDLPTTDVAGTTPATFAAGHLIVVIGADYPPPA